MEAETDSWAARQDHEEQEAVAHPETPVSAKPEAETPDALKEEEQADNRTIL